MPMYALASGNPRVAKMAARNLVASYGAATALLAVIGASGLATVETDWRSPNFGTARVGNTRVDFYAGFKQVARYIAQMKSAQKKTESGKVVDVSRYDLTENFILNKASPVAGLAIGALKQRKWLDDYNEIVKTKSTEREGSSFYPTDTLGRLEQLLAPMSMVDLFEAVAEEGWLVGGALAAPAFTGAGVSTYKSRLKKGDLPRISY